MAMRIPRRCCCSTTANGKGLDTCKLANHGKEVPLRRKPSCRQLLLVASCIWIGAISSTRGQTPAADDFSPEANDAVKAFAVQSDGRVLVGGAFSSVAGQTRNRVARVEEDGTLDMAYNPNVQGEVVSVVIQPDGKVLLGGSFTNVLGQQRNRIARLNADGTLDSTFNPEANGPVYCLTLQPDGNILVGGSFSYLGGHNRPALGRLYPSGVVDPGFNPGGNSSGTSVHSIAVTAEHAILVGGDFWIVGGQSRYLAKLDMSGAADPDFNPVLNGDVFTIKLQADGRILIGGYFVRVGDIWRSKLARLMSNGALDESFNYSISYGALNTRVQSISLSCDRSFVVAGDFGLVNEETHQNIARFTADGSLDSQFSSGARYAIAAVTTQPDGKLLVGGSFFDLAGKSRLRVGRLHAMGPAVQNILVTETNVLWLRAGSAPEVTWVVFEHSLNGVDWQPLGTGTRVEGGWQSASPPPVGYRNVRVRGIVTGGLNNASSWFAESVAGAPVIVRQPASWTNNALTVATFAGKALGTEPLTYRWQKDGVPLEDGGNVSGATTPRLALAGVLAADAGLYSFIASNALGSVTSSPAKLTVRDPVILTQPQSGIVDVGGAFTLTVEAVGTPPLTYQWRRNGVALGSATTSVYVIDPAQTSSAGNFTVVVSSGVRSTTSVTAVVAVNNVFPDAGFQLQSNTCMGAMAVQADGKIMLGGKFTQLSGITRAHIGRLHSDGSVDTSYNPGAGSFVLALAIQPDGNLLVGGSFRTLAGTNRPFLGRLHVDGKIDRCFNPELSASVSCIAVQPDQKIIVAGDFTKISGQTRLRLARLGADGTLDTTFDPAPNGAVRALAVQADGRVLVAGDFSTIAGVGRKWLCRLNTNGTPDTSFSIFPDNSVNAIAVQPDGKILIGGSFTFPRKYLARLNTDGSTDMSFTAQTDGEVRALAIQANRKVLAGGTFATMAGRPVQNLGRVNSNGSPDEWFHPRLSSSPIYLLVLQPDGQILVSDWFSVQRLTNTDTGTQSVNSTIPGQLTWLRGGGLPELTYATCDIYTPESGWTRLTNGIRITDGWRFSPVTVPVGAVLRFYGPVAAGGVAASPFFIEALAGAALQSETASLRMSDQRFEFTLTGGLERPVTIQASTDLIDWSTLTVISNHSGRLLFSDPAATNSPRFYRLLQDP